MKQSVFDKTQLRKEVYNCQNGMADLFFGNGLRYLIDIHIADGEPLSQIQFGIPISCVLLFATRVYNVQCQ